MFAFITPVFSFLFESIFNAHTYVGVFFGIVFAPLWIKIWDVGTSWIISKDPKAAVVVADVTDVANDVVKVVTPIANDINADVSKVLPAGPVTKASKK